MDMTKPASVRIEQAHGSAEPCDADPTRSDDPTPFVKLISALTYAIGTENYNMLLSERRAQKAAAYLINSSSPEYGIESIE